MQALEALIPDLLGVSSGQGAVRPTRPVAGGFDLFGSHPYRWWVAVSSGTLARASDLLVSDTAGCTTELA